MVIHILRTPTLIGASFPLTATAAASMGAHAVGAARRPLLFEFQVPSRSAYHARVGGRILRAVALRLAREAHSAIRSGNARCLIQIVDVEQLPRAIRAACVALDFPFTRDTCAALIRVAVELPSGFVCFAAHACVAGLASQVCVV